MRAAGAAGVTPASLDRAGGAEANLDSFVPATSASGAHVAFISRASNLVPRDTSNRRDILMRRVAR
jgi:hypothetical protein